MMKREVLKSVLPKQNGTSPAKHEIIFSKVAHGPAQDSIKDISPESIPEVLDKSDQLSLNHACTYVPRVIYSVLTFVIVIQIPL